MDLFHSLDDEFHFTLDPCSDGYNALCSRFFTIFDDGLSCSWNNEVVFCNPPYNEVKKWVFKSWEEWYYGSCTVVLLIPSRTDTKWFHTYILPFAEIRFIPGRLRFNGAKDRAPFPSMICVFKNNK